MKKIAALSLCLGAPLGLSTQAHAAFVVEDWTINFESVAGTTFDAPTFPDPLQATGVDALGFNDAPVNASLKTDTGPAGVSVGDVYRIQGKGSIGQLVSNQLGNVSPLGLGTLYEMTFTFDLDVLVDSVGGGGGAFTWSHLAGNDVLSLYVDGPDLGAPGTQANPGTGAGYNDGQQVAVFDVLAGDGGSSNVTGTLDGSDDATFILSSLITPGIITDVNGNEMSVGSTLALTDSNFDLDGDNNGILDFTGGGFGCSTDTNQGVEFFCAQEDGTVRFAVPEPSTLALLGLGFVFAPLSLRQRKKATQ